MEKAKEYSKTYFLTAGETDAQGRMPMWLFIERAIEVATGHANSLDIGYANLIEHGIGWVLTRMSVSVEEYPAINDTYTFTTWIESINRLYSNRCFAVCDAQGREIAHLRSMWVAIDMHKRTAADLSVFDLEALPLGDRQCPVPMQRKMPPLSEHAVITPYKFKFSDIDFNRHVNTVQYVKHILNQWSLSFFDMYQIAQFDIAFHQECYFGETVEIRLEDHGENARCEIAREGQRAIACAIAFAPRQQ